MDRRIVQCNKLNSCPCVCTWGLQEELCNKGNKEFNGRCCQSGLDGVKLIDASPILNKRYKLSDVPRKWLTVGRKVRSNCYAGDMICDVYESVIECVYQECTPPRGVLCRNGNAIRFADQHPHKDAWIEFLDEEKPSIEMEFGKFEGVRRIEDKKEDVMKKWVVAVYEKTEDAVLVEKWIELPGSAFICTLFAKDHKQALLKEAKRLQAVEDTMNK